MNLASGARLGSYEILGRLGAGGMGEVYRARDARIGRVVAIKVLPSAVSADPDRRRRFQKEALTLSSLNHPNILTVYEVAEAGADTYLVMEFVPGENLRSLLAGQPLPMRRLLSIGAQIAAGLARAHAAGVVHRDLKPENIMITPDGFAKIVDFGLAKRVVSDSGEAAETSAPTMSVGTEAGVVLGTIGYMSPEQASGKPIDDRSDQFSLGAILYEMTTGARAFSGEGAGQTLAAILRDDPPPVTVRNPSAPAPLEWLINRCLAKNPADRYASTEDLAREIATLRDHLSDVVRPAARPSSSHRRGIFWGLAGGIAAAALAIAFLASLATAGRATLPPSIRRLSFRRGTIWSARFTPDGETVLYGAAWDADPIETFEARIGSVESRPLPVKNAEILSVSSNGEMAVLLAPRPIFNFMQTGNLARAQLPGGAAREILADVRTADWSPDGKELAIARPVGARDRLECPIGTSLYESRGVIGSARVSPDGNWIALFEYGNGARLVAIRRADRAVRVLSEGWQVWSLGLAWSASGREIWFTATRDEQGTALYAVDLAGRQRLIMRVPGSLQIFDVHRGGRVAMAAVASRIGVAALVPGHDRTRDLSWLDKSFLGDLSPDGRTLLFHEVALQGTNAGSIYLRPTDGSPAVPVGDNYDASPLAFSPDGQRFLALVGGAKTRLEVLPTRTGESKRLPAGSVVDFSSDSAQWLPDNRRILFLGLDGKGGRNVYLQTVDGGEPRPLGEDIRRAATGLSSLAVSPDGALLAIASRDGSVTLHSIAGTEPMRRVPGAFSENTLIGWSDDGRALYSYKIGDLPGRIYRIEIATGESRVWREMSLADPAGVWRIHPVRITSDGRSYAYSYTRRLSDLFVFEGLR